jgi:CubicO group peptidase (beta-lactamase class C family)
VQLAQVAYLVCAAAGLSVLTGLSGQISLGQGAFMAVGAYAAYNLVIRIPQLNFLIVLLLAGGIAAVVVLVLAVYAWAWASLDRSSIARAMWWTEADVGDQFRFPARTIPAGDESGPLPVGVEIAPAPPSGAGGTFDRFLRETDTLAFLVVDDDELVDEHYVGGADRDARQTSFSVAKSFLSTLVGIAIDEGLIGSVDDPVTDYVPELAERDPRFERITLRHLLTMTSGIRYEEQSLPLPWGDDVNTYYGTDLRDLALSQTEIVSPPGGGWLYNNYNPLLLGLVLERATGTSVSDFMATRLWQPLGAEADATWSLDSEDSGFEKLESGLNARPVDYARFGQLLLHDGEWNGSRIVSKDWVREATTSETSAAPAGNYSFVDNYQYFWWIDTQRPGRFYALGNFGQYIYVAPDAGTVIVRNGADWGVDNDTWVGLFRDIADRLRGPS